MAEVVIVPDEKFDEIIPVLEENAKLKKLLSDIAYVAEFGHPAIDRKDDAATLQWIKQAADGGAGS
jgi:hypothetical protein